MITAIKNRVQAWERGLEAVVGNLWAPWSPSLAKAWYDPWRLQEIETRQRAAFLAQAGAVPKQADSLAAGLQVLSQAGCRPVEKDSLSEQGPFATAASSLASHSGVTRRGRPDRGLVYRPCTPVSYRWLKRPTV